MKRILAVALIAAATMTAARLGAQTPDGAATTTTTTTTNAATEERYSDFHFSFFPPLSTHGTRAAAYTNNVSLSALVGLSRNERTMSLAGLANIMRNNATGFQAAGLLNKVGNNARGFQVAGLLNKVDKNAHGFQVAGMVNSSDDANGLQIAGIVNSTGKAKGLQMAGLVNVAGDIEGSQIGGLVNVAGTVTGVQISGFLNIADSGDYPIGIVNIIGNGEMAVGVGYNEIGSATVNFRSGGRVLYGIAGAGYNHLSPEGAASFVAGIGVHVGVVPGKVRINGELTWENIWGGRRDRYAQKSTFALLPALRLGRSIEIFAGPSINHMHTNDTEMYTMFMKKPLWERERLVGRDYTTDFQQLFVGWQAGVQFTIK
jgi:hypothetical protein